MMRRHPAQLAATAFVGLMGLSAAVPALAQQASTSAGSGSRARSTDERVTTELGTPPPVNSDYRRAAEGTLPVVPGGTAPVAGGAIDPAARAIGGVGPSGLATTGAGASIPAGMDVAMLIEHAVAMGIDGSGLRAMAEANKPDAEGNDAVKALLAHAQDEMAASKNLMTKAAAAGSSIDGASPVRKFYGAANSYLATLAALSAPGAALAPNDQAQIAAINNAVKGIMASGHILPFGAGTSPSPTLGELLNHARMMRDEATKAIDQLAGTSPVDPSSPPSPTLLAQRGRDLIGAAGALGSMGRYHSGAGIALPGMNGDRGNNTATSGVNNGLPQPGRLQDERPEIIGGTYGTGSQTAGTATGAEAARNVKNSTEGPNGVLNVPTPDGAPGSGLSGYGVGNNNTPPTNSTAGSRPR